MLACPPCLRQLSRPSAQSLSVMGQFRQIVAGITALASVMGLFFALLRWRMNTPKQHLNLGNVVEEQLRR